MLHRTNILAFVAVVFTLTSLNAQAVRVFIHVQGDSNSQGQLPAGESHFSMDVGAGLNTPQPWPAIMELYLLDAGIDVVVLNHAESGRRLIGRTALDCERNAVGQKDGRVALQQIILTMMNQGGEQNPNNVLIINLGSNDLQVDGLSGEDLRLRLISHVVTILTNPQLQFNLLRRIVEEDRDGFTAFLVRLSRLVNNDTETGGNNRELPAFIQDNQSLIRRLFNLIGWRIVIVPPVLIDGNPFGIFPSAGLAREWPSIVNDVVDFFGNGRMSAVRHAQRFALPLHEEFGGRAHFDAENHADFWQAMADFLIQTRDFDGRLVLQEPTLIQPGFEGRLAAILAAIPPGGSF